MGDLQTQPLSNDILSYENENLNEIKDDESIWGKLFPLKKLQETIDLKKDVITCGRKSDCDILLIKTPVMTKKIFDSFSNCHFTIKKITSRDGTYYTHIYDNSSNGTFINGEKIGKGKFQILNHNDEISLSVADNKTFVFFDILHGKEDLKWPLVVKEKYVILKQLGSGAYGEVRLAFKKNTNERVAIKIISKRTFGHVGKTDNNNNQLMTEVNILKRLRHPCIIEIIDCIDAIDKLYIILELVEGGELFDKIVKIERYNEKTAKLLFYQMILAIKYLHDQGISHRDLKPENILLSKSEPDETLIKITDFGLSKFFDSIQVMKTFCGTPNYLAPEVLITRGAGTYTNKVDNWSLGVILYICLCGYPPFNEEDVHSSLENQIKKGMYTFEGDEWSSVSREAIDLITKLMCTDPVKRFELEEVLEHAWIKKDYEMKRKAHRLMYPENASDESMNNGIGAKKRALHEVSSMDSISRDDEITKRFKENSSNSSDTLI